jgi:hypothetical protein
MDYRDIRSHDPKWTAVRVGQYAVVRLNNDGDIVMVYTVEDQRQLAVAFARSLNIGSAVVLYRASEPVVETVPWQ